MAAARWTSRSSAKTSRSSTRTVGAAGETAVIGFPSRGFLYTIPQKRRTGYGKIHPGCIRFHTGSDDGRAVSGRVGAGHAAYPHVQGGMAAHRRRLEHARRAKYLLALLPKRPRRRVPGTAHRPLSPAGTAPLFCSRRSAVFLPKCVRPPTLLCPLRRNRPADCRHARTVPYAALPAARACTGTGRAEPGGRAGRRTPERDRGAVPPEGHAV